MLTCVCHQLPKSVPRLLAEGLFFMQGRKWKKTRNILTPSFSAAKLKYVCLHTLQLPVLHWVYMVYKIIVMNCYNSCDLRWVVPYSGNSRKKIMLSLDFETYYKQRNSYSSRLLTDLPWDRIVKIDKIMT